MIHIKFHFMWIVFRIQPIVCSLHRIQQLSLVIIVQTCKVIMMSRLTFTLKKKLTPMKTLLLLEKNIPTVNLLTSINLLLQTLSISRDQVQHQHLTLAHQERDPKTTHSPFNKTKRFMTLSKQMRLMRIIKCIMLIRWIYWLIPFPSKSKLTILWAEMDVVWCRNESRSRGIKWKASAVFKVMLKEAQHEEKKWEFGLTKDKNW